jgi:hypothetical protein
MWHKTDVTLRDYFDAKLNALATAVTLSREDLRIWQVAHNDLQRQMKDQAASFINRSKHASVIRQIEAVARLVYVGVGIVLVLQVMIADRYSVDKEIRRLERQ